jgi:hypothetical protein
MPAAPAASPDIVPFWNRLPRIMMYPLGSSALMVIGLFALAELVYMLPFVGFFTFFALNAAMFRYCFECLRSTADGYLEAPDIGSSATGNLGWKFIGLIVILIILELTAASMFGGMIGLLLAVFLCISMPAAAMTLAMEESVVETLNPLKWVTLMMGVGWSYLALMGLCLVILFSGLYAASAVTHGLPLPVALVTMGAILNYVLVMTFHLMGYMLYQFHENLGFVPESISMAAPDLRADPARESLDEIGALVRDGKLEEATERARGLLRGQGGNPAVHAQYRKLLRAADNKTALLEHGRERIVYLIDNDDERGAVELLRECQAIDPKFSPESPTQVTKLAYMAERQNQPKAALPLVEDFEQRFPKSQYIGQACLLAAEVLHEHMGKDDEACAILRRLKAAIPDDPLMPDIDARLQSIERMIAATRKPKPALS